MGDYSFTHDAGGKKYEIEYTARGRFTKPTRDDPGDEPEIEIDIIRGPDGKKIEWKKGKDLEPLGLYLDDLYDLALDDFRKHGHAEPEYEPESKNEDRKRDHLLKLLCENVSAYDLKDAYSYQRIGYEVGDALLEAAAENGLTDEEAEWLFRSKHTRWFMDELGPKISTQAKRLFDQYIKGNRNKVQADIAQLRKQNKPATKEKV